MIIITKEEISNNVYCTPAENSDIVFSHYYFKFTNRITQEIVTVVSTNVSSFDRYQYFQINSNEYFTNSDTGFWIYEIYGWNTITNQVVEPVLESGYMYLNPADTYEPTTYNEQSNEFLTYNG